MAKRPIIWLPRAAPAEVALAEAAQATGWEILPAPVMEVSRLPVDAPALKEALKEALSGAAGIVLTSRHAATILAGLEMAGLGAALHLPVFAVGEATAAAARSAGCSRIFSGDGDAPSLAAMIGRAGLPEGARLCYFSGAEVRHDMAALLAPFGLKVRRVPVYAVRMLAPLPEPVAARWGEIGAVLLSSPRLAAHVGALLEAAGLAREAVRALCLSRAVADAAGSGWRRIDCPEKPDMAAMVALLADGR